MLAATLSAILNPWEEFCLGFVVPIFSLEGSVENFLQKIGNDGRVEGFSSLNEQGVDLIYDIHSISRCKVFIGDMPIIAFMFSKDEIIIGNKCEIIISLKNALATDRFREHPFLVATIRSFCGDGNKINESELQSICHINNNPITSTYHRRYTLPRDEIKREWERRLCKFPFPEYRIHSSESYIHFEISPKTSEKTVRNFMDTVSSCHGNLENITGVKRSNITVSVGAVHVPFYGRISASTTIDELRVSIKKIPIPGSFLANGEHFALQIEGDSMMGAGIYDGDLAIIQRQRSARNGEIIMALIDDKEVALKLWRSNKNKIGLVSCNTRDEILILARNRVQVYGRLCGLFRTF